MSDVVISAIVIAIAAIPVLWVVAEVMASSHKRDAIREQMKRENDALAQEWRSTPSSDRVLFIDRRVKPPDGPVIKVRSMYRRDPRSSC